MESNAPNREALIKSHPIYILSTGVVAGILAAWGVAQTMVIRPLEKQETNLKTDLQTLRQEVELRGIEKLKERAATAESEREAIATKLSAMSKTHDTLEANFRQAAQERDEFSARSRQLSVDNARLIARIKELENGASSSTGATSSTELVELRGRFATLEKERTLLSQERDAFEKKVELLSGSNERLNNRLADQDRDLKKLREGLGTSTAANDKVHAQLAALSTTPTNVVSPALPKNSTRVGDLLFHVHSIELIDKGAPDYQAIVTMFVSNLGKDAMLVALEDPLYPGGTSVILRNKLKDEFKSVRVDGLASASGPEQARSNDVTLIAPGDSITATIRCGLFSGERISDSRPYTLQTPIIFGARTEGSKADLQKRNLVLTVD